MAEARRRSALAETFETGLYETNARSPVLTLTERPAVSLAERRPAALLRLFADVDDAAAASALRRLIRLAPPPAANTAIAGDGCALLWLAPREWLLVCEVEDPGIDEARFAAALAHTSGTVVDVSHAYTVAAIAGEGARELLAKGVPIDLDAAAFAAGACAQTCLGDMSVLLHARHAQAIDLYVGRSYAASLWEWLVLSAAELGYRVARGAQS